MDVYAYYTTVSGLTTTDPQNETIIFYIGIVQNFPLNEIKMNI